MNSNQHSPLWPYLLVLTVLFLLSLAVPQGWQETQDNGLRPLNHRAQVRHRDLGSEVATLHATSDSFGAPLAMASRGDSDWTNSADTVAADTQASNNVSTNEFNVSTSELIAPWAETVAKKIADLRHFDPLRYLHHESNAVSVAGEATPDDGAFRGQQAGRVPQEATDAAAEANWPMPNSLLAQLDRLSQYGECSTWAAEVKQQCLALCQTSPGAPQRASAIVDQLESLAKQAEKLDGKLKSANAASEFRRARYALIRRLALWNVAFPADEQAAVYADVPSLEVQQQRLNQALEAADDFICSISYADAWRSYLNLDEVSKLTDANQNISTEQARQIARQVLARLQPPQPTAAQRNVLQDRTLLALAEQLRTWGDESVDVRQVLTNLEHYETSGLPSDARTVAVNLRQLDWSPSEQNRQLALQLDEHYRNANLRIAISGELLNRLAPDQPTAKGVVNDTILGASVNGTSTTNSQLLVKLIPDPLRLHMWIDAQGTVDSSTESTSGPATFNNNGRSSFVVHKAVLVDRRGLWIANAATEANTDTQLTGVRTDYDNIPLFGSLARRMAVSQHNALLGVAEEETDEKVATQASQQVNAEVKAHFTEAEGAVRKSLFDPLAKLSLSPEPISLETSQQRLTLRLRIAGQNQLGGCSARPQAFSDSLASAQMHESALNNILDQLQLAGRTFTLPELYRHVAERLSWDQTEPPGDLSADVHITFAAKDPVRVRCQNGLVQLTLAVEELEQKARRWNDFAVTINYEPQIEDLHVRLVRQGAIELGGDNYKGQPEVALRGAFSKLFPRERSFELVPEMIADSPRLAGLSITQCVVEDGWIGLALGPERDESPPASAMQNPATAQR
ncbi:MAG TPA: hypothetical protein VFE46_18350 [Pirellulales bacterium]|nr:hypothetical protein [Pirellulales bacterium]